MVVLLHRLLRVHRRRNPVQVAFDVGEVHPFTRLKMSLHLSRMSLSLSVMSARSLSARVSFPVPTHLWHVPGSCVAPAFPDPSQNEHFFVIGSIIAPIQLIVIVLRLLASPVPLPDLCGLCRILF